MKQKGFTLVELLIVISIIALLSTAVTFALQTVQARGRDARRVADMDQLVKALNLYLNENTTYPISASAICIDGEDLVTSALQGADIVQQPFVDPLYPDDSENCYRYQSDGIGSTYSIRYNLETGSVQSKDAGFNFAP